MKAQFHSDWTADQGWRPSQAASWAQGAASGGTGTGANVEVMSPAEVRAELAAVALEIVDLYSNLRLD